MQTKILSIRVGIIIVLTVCILALALLICYPIQDFGLFGFREIKQSSTNLALIINDIGTSSELPIRIKIPSIAVDSAVEYVGLTAEGYMEVPKNRDNVAWFALGTIPGENGSAVIAGHYGFKDGKSSAFDNLHKLREGDKILITDTMGETISFVVRKYRRYGPDADASAVFNSDDSKSHLNLITCEGAWDDASESYPERLVVFTDKE
jgi:LPXTG-site transpeptidase (sortase) family protein